MNYIIVVNFSEGQLYIEILLVFIFYFVLMYVSVVEVFDLKEIFIKMIKYEKVLLFEYQQREGGYVLDVLEIDEGNKEWVGEKYESVVVTYGDKVFYKFNKQLYVYLQQCLR